MVASQESAVGAVSKPRPRCAREHGTYAMAKRGGCKCGECRQAANRYSRRNSKERAAGRSPLVDATPVRAYVEHLVRAGMTPRMIEDASNVHRTAIRVLLGTFPGRNQSKRVQRETARRLMSVKPIVGVAIQTAMVDGTGTRRRLQGLLAFGYTAGDLSQRLGAKSRTLQIARTEYVLADTARKVATLYAELENTPGPSSRAATYYQHIGYLTPAWWDPDTIDNPRAIPAGTRFYVDRTPRQRQQHAPPQSNPTLIDDVTAPRPARVALLHSHGYDPVEIADMIGVKVRYVRRDLLRDRGAEN